MDDSEVQVATIGGDPNIAKQAAEIAKLEAQIETLAGEITVKFGELKKYEIVRDNWLRREREAADKKEAAELDDVAIQQFIRQTEEG